MASVSVSNILALLRYGESIDLDVPRLKELAGVRRQLIDDPSERCPVEALYRLHSALSELTGNELWALEFPEKVPKGSFGLLEYIFRTAGTLGQALESMVRHYRVMSDAITPEFKRTLGGARIDLRFSDLEAVSADVVRTLSQNVASGLVAVGRDATGRRWLPTRLDFAFPEPGDIRVYEDRFGIRPRFSQRCTAISLDRDTLALPIQGSDTPLRKILESYARELLQSRSLGDAVLTERVRAVIAKELQGGDPSLRNVAGRLSTSARSLQRRLSTEGSSFSELLDQVREQLADRYLGDSTLTIDEVAYLLGFSDTPAFNKAFKRWTGMTPGERRQAGRISYTAVFEL